MLSSFLVPDTSIIIASITPDETADITDTIFKFIHTHSIKLIAPSYLQLETYSVIRKKVHFGHITASQAKKCLHFFSKMDITYYPTTTKTLLESTQLATKLCQPTIYDTIFLSLTINYQATYISSDKKLLTKAKTIYPHCYTPQESLSLLN